MCHAFWTVLLEIRPPHNLDHLRMVPRVVVFVRFYRTIVVISFQWYVSVCGVSNIQVSGHEGFHCISQSRKKS